MDIYEITGEKNGIDTKLKWNTIHDEAKNFEKYCKIGDLRKVTELLDYITEQQRKSGFGIICENNHKKIIDYWIKRDFKDWDYGLFGACNGGHIDVVNLMIKKGANNFNKGLKNACNGGHIDVVKLLLEKNAYPSSVTLYKACESNYIDIVKLLVDECSGCVPDRDFALVAACYGGHIDVAKILINSGAHGTDNALRFACKGGHIDIIKLLLDADNKREEMKDDENNFDCKELDIMSYNKGLHSACENNQIAAAKLMIEVGADDLGGSLEYAKEHSFTELIKFLIDKGAENYEPRDSIDW